MSSWRTRAEKKKEKMVYHARKSQSRRIVRKEHEKIAKDLDWIMDVADHCRLLLASKLPSSKLVFLISWSKGGVVLFLIAFNSFCNPYVAEFSRGESVLCHNTVH